MTKQRGGVKPAHTHETYYPILKYNRQRRGSVRELFGYRFFFIIFFAFFVCVSVSLPNSIGKQLEYDFKLPGAKSVAFNPAAVGGNAQDGSHGINLKYISSASKNINDGEAPAAALLRTRGGAGAGVGAGAGAGAETEAAHLSGIDANSGAFAGMGVNTNAGSGAGIFLAEGAGAIRAYADAANADAAYADGNPSAANEAGYAGAGATAGNGSNAITQINGGSDIVRANGGAGFVVLDAGHGGADPGSMEKGVCEKDVTLQVALRTAELLDEAGVDYILTRTEDEGVGIDQRIEYARDESAAIFISIHCDWYEKSRINGTSTLYDANSEASKEMAPLIQSHITPGLGTSDRGVHPHTDLVLLRDFNIPAVVVELGFLSNAHDFKLMKTDAFREQAAQNLACGVVAALEKLSAD